MSISLRHHLILLATCSCVFFLNLGSSYLFDEDEPKNAECGREMYERSDWIVPTYNYDLRTAKPIMLYWLMLGSFNAFGVSEFAARLPSAVMATITILLLYQIASRLFNRKVALWSGIILSSSMMYTVIGRISTPDATLIAFITLAMAIFVRRQPLGENGWSIREDLAWPKACLPHSRLTFVLLYACMGLAVLTKGPVGFLLPCTVIGLFAMCRGNGAPHLPRGLSWRKPWHSVNELTEYLVAFFAPSRFLPALWAMRPFTLAIVVCVVALPWYVIVGYVTDGAWLEGFLGGHNVGRFTSPMEGHSGPIFYYVIAIMLGFFPWSVFLPVTLYLTSSRRTEFRKDQQALLFLLCWAGTFIVFFSLAQTKLPNYVLPAYPPLAVLTAWTLVRWQEGKLELPNWAYVWGGRSLVFAGIALIIAFPIVAYLLLPGYAALGLVGLIPITAGCWMLWHENKLVNRQRVLTGMGVCSILFVSTVFAGLAPWISRAQDSMLMGVKASKITSKSTPLATYCYFTTNLPFYAERPIIRYHSPQEVKQFWSRHPEGVLCLMKDEMGELEEVLPEDVEVVQTVRRFLRPREVVMLRRNLSVTPAKQIAEKPETEALVR